MKKFLLLLLFLIPNLVIAGASERMQECNNKADDKDTSVIEYTNDVIDCSMSELEYEDQRLNAHYKKLMGLLSDEKKILLRKEQRAWIKYRDKEALKFGEEYYPTLYKLMRANGQIGELTYHSTMTELTKKRADELQSNLVMGESKTVKLESSWKQKSGNGYRFTEQYGIQDVRRGDKQFVKRKNDEGRQYVARIDFTFSKKHGWKMYYTATLISDDEIILTIDEKEFVFYGDGIFNKQELTINNEIIKHLKSTKNDFYIQENHPNSDIQYSTAYRTVFKSEGLKNALEWVGK